MMHAIKGGWAGQTFALSKSNDSGGRKSRIRRSKEERKAMVESFIKKYQNSNDGNFPSLNLTHKEVGGSFYTVREIVRDIIQENRVLGPAKLFLEEQKNDNVLEHYPLGSISIDPQTNLSQLEETSNVSYVASKQNQGSSEKLVIYEESNVRKHERLDIEQVLNGSIQAVKDDIGSHEAVEAAISHEGTGDEQLPNLSGQFPDIGTKAADEDEEHNEPILSSPVFIPGKEITEQHHRETSEEQVLEFGGDFPGNEDLKSNSEQAVNDIGIGEKDAYGLPMSRVAVGEDSLDVEKDGRKQLQASNAGTNGAKADIVVEKFPLRLVAKRFDDLEGKSEEQSQETRILEINGTEQDRVHVLEYSSSLMNADAGTDLTRPSQKKKSEPVDKTANLNVENSSSEKSYCSTTQEVPVLDASDVSAVGAKPLDAPVVITENLNRIKTSVSQEKPMQDENAGIEEKLTVECNNSSKQGSNSTLDRINLESWEGTSEKPAASETNPLLAFLKAFVTAFVKFWTE